MSKRRNRRAAKPTSPPGGRSNVVSLADARQRVDLEYARVLTDMSGVRPETGQRTPSASLRYWDRKRFAELSLDRVTSILRSAEDGNTEELADLWLRMLKTDAHLASVWESRIAAVFGAPFAVTAAPVGDPALAQRAAQGCEEVLRQIPDLPAVFSALLDARGVGFAACELIWGRGTILGSPAWVVTKILPIHSRRFRFSDGFELGLYDDGRAVGALREAGWPVTELSSRGAKMARLPAGKYVVHQPVGIHDYPTATGLVHAVARWWWVKQTVTKYWLAGAEIGANPRIIGKLLQTSNGTTMDEFLSSLEALAADGVMVLREGTEVEIKEGTAKSSSEVWDTLFRRMDLAMSKLILGSTLNVEIDSNGGNRAASESQDHVTIRPRQRQDAAQMWCSIARDVFAWVLRFNPHIFAAGSPVPSGRSDIVAQPVAIDQLAVDSGAVRVDEVRARCGLPLIGGADGQRFVSPITRDPGAATTGTPDAPQAPDTQPGQPNTPNG